MKKLRLRLTIISGTISVIFFIAGIITTINKEDFSFILILIFLIFALIALILNIDEL